MSKDQLRIAYVAGIISLLLLVPIIVLEAIRKIGGMSKLMIFLYIGLSILDMAASIFFYRGFVIIGERLKKDFLVAISYVTIIAGILYTMYDLAVLAYPYLDSAVTGTIAIVIFGILSLLLGIALLQLKKKFGKIARSAGVLEIITGITFMTVILSFVGIFLTVIATVLETIILYRASKKL